MPFVKIGDIVSFTPNNGVQVHTAALNASPEDLHRAVALAFEHYQHPVLWEGTYGRGPLAGIFEMTFEHFLEALRDYEISEAGRVAKREHTKHRRSEFNSSRSHLVLGLIEAGVPYVCCIPECGLSDGLTVDHIVPLSRGGTDELSNLRFMCLPHNSAKGDRREA